MVDYRFQSITTSGESRSGVLKGRDRADVIQQLSSRGETATKVEKIKDSEKLTAVTKTRKRRLSKIEMSAMIRELATAQEAGLPLMQALRTIRR